ncbi:MAG TPA: DUF3883 domain-containing protein [Pyrinomonadaceae bacterium]|jgi:hypothetical protein
MGTAGERVTGRVLNERYAVGATHALYREDGRWYHRLRTFPGALFDSSGYILFVTEAEYLGCSQLQIAQDVHAPNGISAIPGYVRFRDLELPRLPTRDRLLEMSPPPVSPTRERRPGARRRTTRKADFAALDEKNRELGKAGEKLVLEYEKNLLSAAGRHDLLAEVRHVAEEEGDGAGYDVRSVTHEGLVKYIEVKTTRGPAATPFMITTNEVRFSEENHEHYYLYRIHGYDAETNSGGLYVLRGNIRDLFTLEPSQFKAVR